MAGRERRKSKNVKMDMTPMIDVVFQLIIFFILTMTVTSQNLKDVVLPTALTAVEEKTDEEDNVLMLHLYNDTATRGDSLPSNLDAWHITAPDSSVRYQTVEEVAQLLTDHVAQHGKQDPNNPTMSNLRVLVRGDLRAPSHYFAVILKACQFETVRIYQVEVSIAPPPDQIRVWEQGQAR
jgi:biopolymer transport protein ExbD